MGVVRRITLADLDLYRELRLRALKDAPSAFGSTYDDEALRPISEWTERVVRAAGGSERALFLAFVAAECVGLAGCVEDDLGADRQLVSMWVAPAHRGTGVAGDLVDAVLGWAAEMEARSIGLWVTKDNSRARRFYERCGFAVTGDVQPLPSDPCKDEIRMIRQL